MDEQAVRRMDRLPRLTVDQGEQPIVRSVSIAAAALGQFKSLAGGLTPKPVLVDLGIVVGRHMPLLLRLRPKLIPKAIPEAIPLFMSAGPHFVVAARRPATSGVFSGVGTGSKAPGGRISAQPWPWGTSNAAKCGPHRTTSS